MEAWLKDSGAVGVEDLEVADFPLVGRGVGAKRAFKEGERILTIPAKCLWTVEHAYADPLLGPVLRSVTPSLSVEDTLALYILFVRSRPDEYEQLRSHVEMLPASYSMSIFFADEELDVCAGSSLHSLTTQLRGHVGDDYKQLLMRVLMRHRSLFPLDKFGIQDYKWALGTVWSRGMDFALPGGTSLRLLAPFADMLNHSSNVKQCHAYDPATGDLSILASRDYSVGDQVFIYYGPVPNSRLLRLYGFVLPDNPHDSYDLVLQTSPMAPLYEQKERLWKLAGLETACTIPLTSSDPLPDKVLQYLRIQRLDDSELSAMATQIATGAHGKVSDENETQILQFLAESIKAILEGFAIPSEELAAQLADGVYPEGGNAWAAAQVSAGEQRVLKLAQERAEGLLAAVGDELDALPPPNRCTNCRKDSAQLMACGRCKAVKYCGRDCQVAHFKEHKTLCRSFAGQK
ncbi:Rubisco LS methyltransferase, substrate-binding domain protein [Akanthomyces lecanii RCEF 1005]|uniref:Rubisco LS methyltransferase, substrate-binding domain protein n=1 Tax=Akanthomyces lecanii RCEF 1005 TaxID=1081108 RepID=A0A168CTA7_CORDF|nr:Rubisco LS methyltransferase, substrate-binding domain protein [Akanthomyces lecanii RCEF 1005]